MSTVGEHAVVLGAGVSGLLAARVLTEFYDHVTLVERDILPDGIAHRRGVPQGRHIHVMLASGSAILDELFPGILDELADDGAAVLSAKRLADLWQEFGGHCLRRESGAFAGPMGLYQASRPFLEGHIRRRLRASGNLTVLDDHDVVDLLATNGHVTGAKVAARGTTDESALAADLVVDATGRGARTPAFLERLGYGRPVEQGNVVRVTYTSQLVRVRPPAPAAKLFLIGAAPGRYFGGALAACENNTWILTSVGVAGHEPPTEWAQTLTAAEKWAPGAMMSALRRAEPIGEPVHYRYPTSQWRRYDRLRRFPEGILVFGDAICSFNPIYGQGMSVAALEALALRDCLSDGATRLSRRFFAAAAKPIAVAYGLAAGADLAVPETEGTRTIATRASQWYTARVLAACPSDLVLHEKFMRVMNLLEPPSQLMTPAMISRTLIPRRRNRQSDSDSPSRSAAAT